MLMVSLHGICYGAPRKQPVKKFIRLLNTGTTWWMFVSWAFSCLTSTTILASIDLALFHTNDYFLKSNRVSGSQKSAINPKLRQPNTRRSSSWASAIATILCAYVSDQHCYSASLHFLVKIPVRFNSGPMSVASSCASRPSFDQARLEMIKKMQNIENSQNTISEVRSAVRGSMSSVPARTSSNLGFVPRRI